MRQPYDPALAEAQFRAHRLYQESEDLMSRLDVSSWRDRDYPRFSRVWAKAMRRSDRRHNVWSSLWDVLTR